MGYIIGMACGAVFYLVEHFVGLGMTTAMAVSGLLGLLIDIHLRLKRLEGSSFE